MQILCGRCGGFVEMYETQDLIAGRAGHQSSVKESIELPAACPAEEGAPWLAAAPSPMSKPVPPSAHSATRNWPPIGPVSSGRSSASRLLPSPADAMSA